MGKFGYIAIAMNSEKAWSASAFHPFEEVHGDSLQQMRLQHPLTLARDWRKCFDKVEVSKVEPSRPESVRGGSDVRKEVAGTFFVNADSAL